MNKTGPIIIIEDDPDDQDILKSVFEKLNYDNEVLYFSDGEKALEYLLSMSIKPFLILSDINMPRLNGMELREKIYNNEQLNLRCIPYLFLTTAAEQPLVLSAYSKSVQGFFVKPSNLKGIEKLISSIMNYWKECHSPDL
ncbi:MAG: response regulator [Daejeonella sp.]|nr:response regulator [Daejeonella sp.]